MKTVITDNSLCAYPLRDDADPDLIFNYIRALKDAGVRYIELDFRTLMKLRRLPEGVGYIFRMVDPMFLSLSEVYDFKYIVITYKDLGKRIKTDIPVMFEAPYVKGSVKVIPDLVKGCVDGELGAVRVRWGFEYETPDGIFDIHKELSKGFRPYPIDICPLAKYKTALDTALKFTAANVDSITLTAGNPAKYCSLEEYFFALMTIFDNLPPELDIQSLGRVSVYRNRIFQSDGHALMWLMDVLDRDIRCLKNVESGEHVPLRISLKDSEYLNHRFVTALEKMANEQDIPSAVMEDLAQAIKHFDRGVYNDDLLHRKRSGLLN